MARREADPEQPRDRSQSTDGRTRDELARSLWPCQRCRRRCRPAGRSYARAVAGTHDLSACDEGPVSIRPYLPRYHSSKLHVDEQEAEALYENTDSSADRRGIARHDPSTHAEHSSHSNESDVEADVHPKQSFSPCGSREITKTQSVPFKRGNRADHDPPERHLQG